ncbi:hypothetical protein COCCADRAFT_41922 [Bipolaris zeicola 26-R-13]|uniref:Uncharacterized protein n=1 Tax=Cochliobolus carbonum (strain 26-R-13) TaxID=930089 RepID=W6XX63_COCC2|nr:uncharacterized protein COCCADRAFT_41922 [Bipolaris zeicola 26-R-13]EUC27329.1 hypothetical protein COCCADRAFT_41922 [Bipolaris zeicola 26-R-13]
MSESLRSQLCLGFRRHLECLDTWGPGSLSVIMKPTREQGPRASRSVRAPKVSSEAFQHPLLLGPHIASFRFASQLTPIPFAFVISAPDERTISGLVQSPTYPLPVRMRHVGRWLSTIIRS